MTYDAKAEIERLQDEIIRLKEDVAVVRPADRSPGS